MSRLRHRTRASAAWTALLAVGIAGAWTLSGLAFGDWLRPAGAAVKQHALARPVPAIGHGCTAGTGPRVRTLYVVGDRQPDRYSRLLPEFRRIAADVDVAIADAGRRTGGERHVRFVQDAACLPVVDHVVLPQAEMGSAKRINAALRAQGYDRPDRKYLYWYDAPGCDTAASKGRAGHDRSPGPANAANQGPSYAGVGVGCWSWQASARALLRTLGAAPDASSNGRCHDGRADLLSAATGPEIVIDCNADAYFNVSPPAGSYLDTHWNVARSAFLTS